MQNMTISSSRIKAFWERVDRSGGPDACWPWNGAINNRGYGQFGVCGGSSGVIGAHRMAYSLFYGHIPEGQVVCHTCDNPSCCNPFHLFIGSQKDNIADCIRKGHFHFNQNIGETNPNHKLTSDQVREILSLDKTGKHTTSEIAANYGVNPASIRRILCGHSWKEITRVVNGRDRTRTYDPTDVNSEVIDRE